ncbi:cardioactive peptide [Coccinella septempunctata]|uniref:cardioactive peptide n=1 Tax=Coccinella septempunctata TaxID=41139 RepID=UPI001D079CA2|nr:cardioactive peptide [Coccinella septempunctata]
MDPKKRPFCNAFTGCGRKRSNLPALTSDGEEIDDSISALLELNAEPAVENLSRQIMSEAKLWEAIQEANMELNRHRQKTKENISQKNKIQVAGTCALPPCYTI